MARDLKFDADGVHFSVRAGLIMRYRGKIVCEVSRVGRNSVVPGGRVKLNEHSRDAILREADEEMGLKLDASRLVYVKNFENFFQYDGIPVHEIYFLYEYELDGEEAGRVGTLGDNMDNDTTYFTFIDKSEAEKYNLLPTTLYPLL